ncbi:MAG: alpha/beta hydrolase, partial [Actinomycetota bacterium]|nr:alpha/beta hydrolase [Actinomycetota bacterium]
ITAQHRTFNATARYLEHPDGMVALDLRGRGDSGKPSPGNYGLDMHVRDVVRALDHLGVERAVLVGHSMGAFVALHTALLYPDRVGGLVLLDGGWPRPEEEPDEEEAAAIAEGLERAYRRLDMVFETPNDYLDFWFPGQNLTLEDLAPDLADYYLYDLEKVDGGYTPKASREAAEEDGDSFSSESPTAEAMRGIGCPAALVRAEEGFFPGTRPLISDETRDVMAGALDLRLEHRLQGANHYTMMFFEFARQVAATIDDLLRRMG